MINQAVYNLSLTKAELKQLALIKPWKGDYWDNPPNQYIFDIKMKIRQQLESSQTVCSYCGLKLGGTSKGEVEHIAPKSKSRHPDFTFTLKNLTFACHLCNFSDKKGQKEVVSVKKKTYLNCGFLLVHPYFDNPNDHYEWTDNLLEILIQAKNNSPKGLFSIDLFDLASPRMNELRAQEVIYEKLKLKWHLSIEGQILINNILDYKE